MRYVEHRRHTMRTKPGKHLSQAGVDLARRVGTGMGPFQRVVTSKLPRAFETAIAMGFAVDYKDERLNETNAEVEGQADWSGPFAAWARAGRRDGPVARFIREQARLLQDVADDLSEEGRALVVSHGGFVEAGAVGCLPEADHVTWGGPCDYCEGVLLTFAGTQCVDAEILRVGELAFGEHR